MPRYSSPFNNLPVTVIRSTDGPRQSARAVIPTIITQLASGKREVRLGALPTALIGDPVAGFLAALEANRIEGQVINLGSGFEISIGDTAQTIAG